MAVILHVAVSVKCRHLVRIIVILDIVIVIIIIVVITIIITGLVLKYACLTVIVIFSRHVLVIQNRQCVVLYVLVIQVIVLVRQVMQLQDVLVISNVPL